METLKVAALIEALRLIGQAYRNKDGTQPAEPLRKVLQQFDGAPDMTLGEWVALKQSETHASQQQPGKEKAEIVNLDEMLASLERERTHAALSEAIARLSLSGPDWQALAKKLTGKAGRSGKAAREAVQTRLSDRLLLEERVEGVTRQFNALTPPPAVS